MRKSNNSKSKKTDCELWGVCCGMSIGVLFGSVSGFDLGICLSMGALLGLFVGMCIEKNKPQD